MTNTTDEAYIDRLRKLSCNDHAYPRYQAASNPDCPPDALLRLAYDPESRVRYHTAKNPNTPYQSLLRLACDEYEDVREAAINKL